MIHQTARAGGVGLTGSVGRDRRARIHELEGWHFWFRGRRDLVRALLARHLGNGRRAILDVGCGSGLLARELARAGHRVTALDLLPDALRRSRMPGSLQGDAVRLPLRGQSFDAVTLLDVLEHVDDTRALAEARRVLRPGGLLLITVPAMPWLWSYRDRAAGHRRRYTRSALRRLAEDCGFEVAELRYYQCALLPLVAASRLGGRRNSSFEYAEERPPRLLNELFAWINGAEARLHADLPWGTSLAAAWHRSGA